MMPALRGGGNEVLDFAVVGKGRFFKQIPPGDLVAAAWGWSHSVVGCCPPPLHSHLNFPSRQWLKEAVRFHFGNQSFLQSRSAPPHTVKCGRLVLSGSTL